LDSTGCQIPVETHRANKTEMASKCAPKPCQIYANSAEIFLVSRYLKVPTKNAESIKCVTVTGPYQIDQNGTVSAEVRLKIEYVTGTKSFAVAMPQAYNSKINIKHKPTKLSLNTI
jgi:hypothetical protein